MREERQSPQTATLTGPGPARELSREQAGAGAPPVYLTKGINKQKKYKGPLRWYYQKAVRCGNFLELYQYKEMQTYIAREATPGRRGYEGGEVSEDKKRDNRRVTLGRAKKRVRRLINANSGRYGHRVVLLTLTFGDAVRDIPKANYEFKKFRQRLEYRFDLKLKYVTVIEFQDENRAGVIHYHVAIFNLPFIPINDLRERWGNGFLWIDARKHGKNPGAYMTKYMVKNIDDKRLQGKKCYFCSRGLIEPEIVYSDDREADLTGDKVIVWGRIYESEYEGTVMFSIWKPDAWFGFSLENDKSSPH